MVNNIVFYFSSLILLLSGLACLMYSYYKEHDCVYKFTNTFPYELNYGKTNSLTVVGKILIVLSLLTMGAFFVVYPFEEKDTLGNIKVIASFITVFGILALLSAGAIFVSDMKNVKVHLGITTLLIGFSFILNIAIALMGFWTLKNIHAPGDVDWKKIICSIVACLFFIFHFIIICNPKLRNWAKLEEKANEDGSKIYLRPKFFPLAYTEWTFIFSVYADAMLLFIMFI